MSNSLWFNGIVDLRQVGASWAFMERFIQIAVSWFHFPKKNRIGFRTNLMYYHKCLKISAGYGQNLIWFRNFKAFMIVHNIRSKSDPIFLRKVKSANRDLDKTLNWNPLGLCNELNRNIIFTKAIVLQ